MADDPIKKAREHIRKGTYIIRKHAMDRQEERMIQLADILNVLEHGFHEEKHSLFDTKYQLWKYAIRGKSLDRDDLRVIIAFPQEMAIITVMRITKKWL